MSLYNMLFGVNPWAGLCLQVLNIKPADVPRFRDAFIDDETGDIVIYTRTGGGNRAAHESEASYIAEYGHGDIVPEGPYNEDLRKLPGYKYDKDDGFDSTYAYFYFEPAEEWKPILKTAKELSSASNPHKKWENLLEELKASNNTSTVESPEVKRALEVGKAILDQLDAIISK